MLVLPLPVRLGSLTTVVFVWVFFWLGSIVEMQLHWLTWEVCYRLLVLDTEVCHILAGWITLILHPLVLLWILFVCIAFLLRKLVCVCKGRVLASLWLFMTKLFECFLHVAWHWQIDLPFNTIPVESDSNVFAPRPIFRHWVVLLEYLKKILCVLLANILYAKIVDH